MKNEFIKYKDALKQIRKQTNLTEAQLHRALENGELSVRAMHPVLKMILPYKISKIQPDGRVEGEFINA